MDDMGIEEVVKNGLETGKGFRLVYALGQNGGKLGLYAATGAQEFELEPLSYSEIGNAVKGLVAEKYGELEVVSSGFRTETVGNGKVAIEFDPGWGSFVIDVRVK